MSTTAPIHYYKAQIKSRYELTDLGPINWLLGIKISRDRKNRTNSLSQLIYIDSRNSISRTLYHFQLPLIRIFAIRSPNAHRYSNKPPSCAESRIARPLGRYYTLPIPRAPISLFRRVFSHSLWRTQVVLIGRVLSESFAI